MQASENISALQCLVEYEIIVTEPLNGSSEIVQVEDIIFLVRKNPRMYARVRELLTMNEELKKARKAFDEVKYVQGSK